MYLNSSSAGYAPALRDGGADNPERQDICGDRLDDVMISGFQGAVSIPGARAILIENSRGVRQ
jgi:hypothetical protein